MASVTDHNQRIQNYLDKLAVGEPTPVFIQDGQHYMRCRMVLDLPAKKITFTDTHGNIVYNAEIPAFDMSHMIIFEEITVAITMNIGSSAEDENPF